MQKKAVGEKLSKNGGTLLVLIFRVFYASHS